MKKLVAMASAVLLSLAILLCTSVRSGISARDAGTTPRFAEFPTVVIDAGHGGFDGGASTADGIPEKNINLAIALFVNDYLTFFGFDTVMVRTEDVSTEEEGLSTLRSRKTSDLHNRMKVMESTENAVFVSIHQNHFTRSKYWGAQVFFSPFESDSSSRLARCIQTRIVEDLQPENTRQIKPIGTSVYLVYHAVCPAVLVECGFLSNPEEALLLQQTDYQQKTAYCIALGILEYCTKEA